MQMEKLTSRENGRLVRVRKIRDGKEPTRIFIEGRRLVVEALRSALVLEECFVAEGFADTDLLKSVRRRVAAIAEVPDRIFNSIADTRQPQGIIVIAKRPNNSGFAVGLRITAARLPLVIFLNEVNNPSNLGAILRTAEAAGAAGVIVSANSADVYSSKSLRAAMGASFRLPVWDRASAVEVFSWATDEQLITTAAEASAPVSYLNVDWTKPRLLIFGSEAHGLRGLDPAVLDEAIAIPMRSEVESLNLAVSAGIILFEAARQVSLSQKSVIRGSS